jgi:hypothetical protein
MHKSQGESSQSRVRENLCFEERCMSVGGTFDISFRTGGGIPTKHGEALFSVRLKAFADYYFLT